MRYNTFDFCSCRQIKQHGRCGFDDGALTLSWSNSGFEFEFYGDGFVVTFGGYSCQTPGYLRVFVDGMSQRFALVNGDERICYDGLGEGKHNVKILRITEGTTLMKIESVTLCGSDPYLLDRPADKKLKLEFYGDSITCGYGVLGSDHSPGYVTFEQDSTRTYAYMTSEMLDADGRYMCQSGKGIVANCLGNREDMKISDFWAWKNTAAEPWDFSKWTPDICILNCGTNDAWGGICDDEFVETGVRFLANVRKAYPQASILWAYGMMDDTKLGAVERAVRIFNENDGNAYFFHIASMNYFDGEVGGGGHPNTVTSERASKLLAQKIKEILESRNNG